MNTRTARLFALSATSLSLLSASALAQTSAKRPMTFLDAQLTRQIGAETPSYDGKWLLYTLSTPDWQEAKRQTDLYLVSLDQGLPSTRQLTFTKDKNEAQPRWSRDGSFFVIAPS